MKGKTMSKIKFSSPSLIGFSRVFSIKPINIDVQPIIDGAIKEVDIDKIKRYYKGIDRNGYKYLRFNQSTIDMQYGNHKIDKDLWSYLSNEYEKYRYVYLANRKVFENQFYKLIKIKNSKKLKEQKEIYENIRDKWINILGKQLNYPNVSKEKC